MSESVSSKKAVVVGAGPNGFAAAITLAREGWRTVLLEASDEPGGAVRTAEWLRPGVRHDVCSAVFPLAVASPFLRELPLEKYGLKWIHPTFPLVHPMDDGPPGVLDATFEVTAERWGEDGATYERLLRPFVRRRDDLFEDLLGPLKIPRHPWLTGAFGLRALRSAEAIAARFAEPRVRALWAGLGGHSFLPLEGTASAAIALVLAVAAHADGWPLVEGGAGRLTEALADHFRALGGELRLGTAVRSSGDLPPADLVLFDLSAANFARTFAEELPSSYVAKLARFRGGPGVFKVDWILAGPIPWRDPEARRAGTLHLGGSFAEIAASERALHEGRVSEKPFVLASEPTVFDGSRAPAGVSVAWGYCHVPAGSEVDMTARIEAQVERYAPGFRDLIVARHASSPRELEAHNANLVGGDISGGLPTLWQTFNRPTSWRHPYRLPKRGWYLCSSSTPPGAGVHGLSGFHAARAALADFESR